MKGRKKRQKLKHLYLIWCNSLEAVFSLWSVELIHCVARATKMKNDIQDKKGAKKSSFYILSREMIWNVCNIAWYSEFRFPLLPFFSLSFVLFCIIFLALTMVFSLRFKLFCLNLCTWYFAINNIVIIMIVIISVINAINWSDQIIVSCPLARLSLFIDWHLFAWARLFRLLVKYTRTVSLSVYSLHLDWFIECLLWFI